MIKTIVIGDHSFNVAQASAANQRTVMNIISRYVMANALALAKMDQKISPSFIKGVLFSLSESELVKISDLLLAKCTVSGESSLIDIKFFQGKMNTYYSLLAESICYNLADFFSWLDSERSAENPTAQQAQ